MSYLKNKKELKKIVGKINNIDWQKIGQWKTPFLMDYIILEATKLRKFQSQDFLFFFKNFYIINGEFTSNEGVKKLKRYFAKNYKKYGYSFLKKYSQNMSRVSKQTLTWALELPNRSEVEKLTNQQLKKLFNIFVKKMTLSIIAWAYILFGVDKFFSQYIRKRLKFHLNKIKSRLSIDEVLSNLILPQKTAFMIKEQEDLLRLASLINRNKKLKKIFITRTVKQLESKLERIDKKFASKIKKHHQSYAWMNSLNWDVPLHRLSYYLKRIKDFIQNDPEEKLLEMRKESRLREKQVKDIIKEISLSEDICLEINLIRDFIDAKMLNWDIVSISGYRMRPVIEEIAQRNSLVYDDILSCAPEEINQMLESGLCPDRFLLKQRRECRALIRLGKTIYCYTGSEASMLKKVLVKGKKVQGKLLKGQIGFSGKLRGRVNIIFSIDEINKMKKNDILVCPMTNPDYMPAISKAIGIITDEGGILCHAMIVSREFKIPCVVGTKIATKVLKDGDLVEVDANKGVVKIIKNKN